MKLRDIPVGKSFLLNAGTPERLLARVCSREQGVVLARSWKSMDAYCLYDDIDVVQVHVMQVLAAASPESARALGTNMPAPATEYDFDLSHVSARYAGKKLREDYYSVYQIKADD